MYQFRPRKRWAPVPSEILDKLKLTGSSRKPEDIYYGYKPYDPHMMDPRPTPTPAARNVNWKDLVAPINKQLADQRALNAKRLAEMKDRKTHGF